MELIEAALNLAESESIESIGMIAVLIAVENRRRISNLSERLRLAQNRLGSEGGADPEKNRP